MKKFLPLCLAAALILAACSKSLESQGDDYLKLAEKSESVAQKKQYEKQAYKIYLQAVNNKRETAPTSLKNKFIEATLIRMDNLKKSAGITNDIMNPLQADINRYIHDEGINNDVKNHYARFLTEYADTLKELGNLTKCVMQMRKASDIATDKAIVAEKFAKLKDTYSTEKIKEAKELYKKAEGDSDDPDIETLLKADYQAHAVLNVDSGNTEAKELIAKITPKMLDTYRAYQRVYPDPVGAGMDTSMYRAINKKNVFMAIKDRKERRGKLTLEGLIMHSEDGFKAVRLQDKNFTLVLEDGTELSPTSAKFSARILDVSREEEFTLTFSGVDQKVKSLIYSSFDKDVVSKKRFY
ncbi:MAG: hypothetical protein ACQEQV_08865 [Fibrobacterota bacterium]